MTTTVANVRDGVPPNSVYIGRARDGLDGYFGNPLVVGRDGSREEVIALYRQAFYTRLKLDAAFYAAIEGLRGKVLLCHCAPLTCHGDVIAEYLNGALANVIQLPVR